MGISYHPILINESPRARRKVSVWNRGPDHHVMATSYPCICLWMYVCGEYKRRLVHPYHDDVIKWKHFPRNWPFVRGIHRSPVNSRTKASDAELGFFSLIRVWINGWVNNREAGDLRRYRTHYDVIVMWPSNTDRPLMGLHPMLSRTCNVNSAVALCDQWQITIL